MTPRRLMAISIGVALVTIALKTLAWWLTGSVGLLSDAMESFVNLAAATFGFVMVSVAEAPPDEDHPFGHDKAEYFSSGFEGILIIGAAVAIIWMAVLRFWHPQALMQVGWGLALAVISSIFNALLAWIMLKAARLHRSIALEADARHLLTDVWTSAGVIAGILLVSLSGWLWLDPLIAIGVALHIMLEGFHLIRRSWQGLMDTALSSEDLEQIEAILEHFTQDWQAGKTVHFDHLLTRKAGQRNFAIMHMHLPPQWTLQRAAKLRQEVEQALLDAIPGLHVSIEMLPDGVEPIHILEPQEASTDTPGVTAP